MDRPVVHGRSESGRSSQPGACEVLQRGRKVASILFAFASSCFRAFVLARVASGSLPILLVTLACLPLLTGCRTSLVRRGVERRIERKLESRVGPADRYRVRIIGTRDSDLVLGRAHHVEVEAQNIFARHQIRVAWFKMRLFDLIYEGGEPSFVSIKHSDVEIHFTEQALNDYLDTYHSRYQPEVRLNGDRVHVHMVYNFLGKPTTLVASGRFLVQDGTRLVFDADTADVSFINTPGFGEKFVEDRVNPLLDLSRIDFPARLESVEIRDGRIRAKGTAHILPDLAER